MEIQTTKRGRGAFSLTELLVVIGVVAVLAAMLLPANSGPRRKWVAQRINCINNLKQDALASKLWANDNGGKYPMEISFANRGAMEFAERGIACPIFQAMSNELSTPRILICPADEKHFPATNFTTDFNNSKISYFVGLNASEANPQSFLAGDDNFAINGKPVQSGILNLQGNRVEWTNERHHRAGNIALADGSVQQINNESLEKSFETGAATNRLVIP
ncbi:MAG TPA: type II secretion system protein [Methylomirabilota bacterium]|nr:type II secretion system protein [Methylomirabilota bacterium]